MKRICSILDSDMISEVAYDVESQFLWVKFQNGSVYRYSRVPSEGFAKVVSNQSVGEAFNHFIKPFYTYIKV